MSGYYDVIVAGGSISGLLAAREIAGAGLSVAVLEEDSEVGTPEHVVDLSALVEYKISVLYLQVRLSRIKSDPQKFFLLQNVLN